MDNGKYGYDAMRTLGFSVTGDSTPIKDGRGMGLGYILDLSEQRMLDGIDRAPVDNRAGDRLVVPMLDVSTFSFAYGNLKR